MSLHLITNSFLYPNKSIQLHNYYIEDDRAVVQSSYTRSADIQCLSYNLPGGMLEHNCTLAF